MFFKKRRQPYDPMANVRNAHFWLPYQLLAMNLGLTRAEWEAVKVEFEVLVSTGDSIADFMFAARLAGIEVQAPADSGKEPWDAHAGRVEEGENP